MGWKVKLETIQEMATRGDEARNDLESLADHYANAVYIGDDKALAQVLARYLMVLDTRDYAVSPHLIMHGCWEAWITVRLLQHLRPGMVCADIGSNMGYYTCLMADVCGAHNVTAVDPLFDCRTTLGMNGFDDVTFVQAALGDHIGEAALHVPKGHASSATLNPRIIRGSHETQAVVVKVMRFGQLEQQSAPLPGLPDGRRFDFVKIDAEGAEPEIWSGMQASWLESPDMQVCLEFDQDFYVDPHKVLASFAETARVDVVDDTGALVRGIARGAHRNFDGVDALLRYMGEHNSNMLWLTHERPDQAVKER